MKTLKETARHEAAHAVVAAICGLTIEKVTVVPDRSDVTDAGMLAGACILDKGAARSSDRLETLIANALMLLAGPVFDTTYSDMDPDGPGKAGWEDDLSGCSLILRMIQGHALRQFSPEQASQLLGPPQK